MTRPINLLIAGHRPDRLHGQDLSPLISRVIGLVAATARDLAEPHVLRIMTGGANGTDAWAAEATCDQGLPLHVVSHRRPEWPAGLLDRAERSCWIESGNTGQAGDLGAFAEDHAVGTRDAFALAFADCLLIVWDGKATRGATGGTVRLAHLAALSMKPVIWIDLEGRVRWLQRERISGAVRHRLSAPVPDPDALTALFSAPLDDASLRPLLNVALLQAVLPWHLPATGAAGFDAHALRYRDLGEAPPEPGTSCAGRLDRLFMRWLACGHKSHPAEAGAWDDSALGRVCQASEIAASHAAGCHRDSTWLLYMASAAAVFAAVAGAIGWAPKGMGAFWAIMEVALIAGIVGLLMVARKAEWHGRWIGNRFLVEQLRCAWNCMPMLVLPATFLRPAWTATSDNAPLVLTSPELWMLHRALAREGIPPRNGGSTVLDADASFQPSLRSLEDAIAGQVAYQQDRHHRFHRAHQRLHALSYLLFGSTAAAVGAHFVIHASWLLVCTAFFPALAAAIHGISTKLEIERIAKHAEDIAHRLTALKGALAGFGKASRSGEAALLELRQLALEASSIMSDENAQWQELIGQQPTGLPA